MPVNEVAENIHNFFEQDNLSKEVHYSQVATDNWPVLRSNLLVGNRRQIDLPVSPNTNDYGALQSDSGRETDRQPSQATLDTSYAQLTLRPEFVQSQFSNQQLNLNGFIHGHEGAASDQLKLRGLSIIAPETGNDTKRSPFTAKLSERLDGTNHPINFDVLCKEQQLLRGQRPSMPQPQPGQQSGFADMQLWQQQLMLKQLQELQRQKQLQQLDQEARQQNQMNQLSAIARQTAHDQLPALVNGTPLHDASNLLWQNELMGGDTKLPNSSQMFMAGNMTWAQRGGSPSIHGLPNGLSFSHEQGQELRSMGLVPLQHEQSLYGAPVASARSNFNQYSHIQGISQDYADVLTKGNGNQLERPILPSSAINNSFQADQSTLFPHQINMQDGASVSRQGFQGNFFGNSTFPGMNSGVQLGNLQQFNTLPSNASMQEFQGRQQQAGWSGNVQEKSTSQVGPSQGVVSLDPTEKKILFSSDDDMWDGSMGRSGMIGTGGYGNALESMDYLSGFPSIQSGTWSALMQSAVAEASSSDTGMQDEWSGLSFQKMELSTGNQPATLSDSARQPADWPDNNLQTASSLTSRPFPLFDDAKTNLSGGNASGLHQSSIKNSYEQTGRVQPDVSHESIHQSSKESSKWFSGHQQKLLVGGSHQVQPSIHLGNASQAAWARQMYEQSANAVPSTDMESNAHNLQGSWIHRQSMTSYNVENHPSNKPSGWNINESVPPGGDAALGIGEIGNSLQRSQSNDIKRATQMERERDGGTWKSDDNCAANTLPNLTGGLEQVKPGTGHQVNREALSMSNFTALANSSAMKTTQETSQQVINNHQTEYGKHVIDSSLKYKGEENVGKYQNQLGSPVVESQAHNSDRESGETFGGGLRENSWLSPSESRPLASGSQKSSVQVGRKASGSRRFQYHPMGNLEVDMESADNSKRITHPQAPSQPVSQVTKNHEQDYFGRTKFVGPASNNAIDMEKGHLPDFQGNAKAASSFDGSTGFYAQSKRNAQTCQNMLELFHKVDQPREQRTLPHFSSSDHNLPPESSEPETSDASVSQQWRSQSAASQGFGLRLAPPSQRLPASNLAISSQNSSPTLNGPNSRHADPSVGDKSQTWLTPTSNAQALSSHETSPREQQNNRSNISGQTGSESSLSSMQKNSSATFTLPYSRDQARQLLPSASGQVTSNQSAISSSDGLASHLRETHDAHKGILADQSALGSLPGTSGRIAPFNLAQSVGISKPLNNNLSHGRVPGEHLPILESVPVSQSSITGKSQQGAFSTMLHNVWTNVSAQQHLAGGMLQKIPPNLFHSFNPSNSNFEKSLVDAQRPHQDTRKHGPDFGTCSINSEQVAHGQGQPGRESSWQQTSAEKVQSNSLAIQGQQSLAKHQQDANSSVSGSLMVHPHQELDRGKYGKDPALGSQLEHASHGNSSASRDIEAFGRSLKQHLLHQNYSLLHQVQAMKAMESDPNTRGGKRFKATDIDSDAQQFTPKSGPQLFDGSSNAVRDVDGEQNAAAQRPSGDSKMLSFSSEGREDHSANTSSQLVLGDLPSQDVVAFGRNESHNHSSHLSGTAMRSENAQISPQMAPSWFEQYGSFKNGQILPIYDAPRTSKPAVHQLIYGKMPENVHTHSATQQQVNVVGASQGGVCMSTVSTFGASEHSSPSHSLPSEVADQSLALTRPKKRKPETSGLPWHKEIINVSERLQSVSMAEQDWAQAANRLVEKVEDEVEMVEDGLLPIRPRRRLILTTQLMQQLFRPAPASILSADANSNYETVTYYIAKLELGEACGLISSSRSESCSSALNGNITSGFNTSDRVSDQYFSKIVEDFIGRARKLEADLVRLDKRASILDIRVESQDLERFSVINRFAKFHGRPQADVAETSSTSDAAATTQKTCPQRYVTALAMPRNLPEGVQCLSL